MIDSILEQIPGMSEIRVFCGKYLKFSFFVFVCCLFVLVVVVVILGGGSNFSRWVFLPRYSSEPIHRSFHS